MAEKENWFIKNIFSIISVLVLIGGIITGYVRLQSTVDNLKLQVIDKETIRTVVNECLVDKMALINKDILYIQNNLTRMESDIRAMSKGITITSRKK